MRRFLPVIVLFLLSPFVAEVLFGATPISNLGALLPIVPLYGGGAVLIRELARRRDSGWGRIVLFGIAFAIVEEGVVLQSLFNPTLFGAAGYGGRVLGVNWVWSIWTVGYHTVWSILIPILLAELLFPVQGTKPWLGRTGMIVCSMLFALGAVALAAIFRLFVASDFRAPIPALVAAALAVVLLVALALAWPPMPPRSPRSQASRTVVGAPSPWLVAIVALLAAAGWFALLSLPAPWRVGAEVIAPLLGALLLVTVMSMLLRAWSSRPGWDDLHRLALVWGALLVVMGIGYFRITAGNPMDQAAQGVISFMTIGLLAIFTKHVWQRERNLLTV